MHLVGLPPGPVGPRDRPPAWRLPGSASRRRSSSPGWGSSPSAWRGDPSGSRSTRREWRSPPTSTPIIAVPTPDWPTAPPPRSPPPGGQTPMSYKPQPQRPEPSTPTGPRQKNSSSGVTRCSPSPRWSLVAEPSDCGALIRPPASTWTCTLPSCGKRGRWVAPVATQRRAALQMEAAGDVEVFAGDPAELVG